MAGVAGALTIPVSVHVAVPKGHMTLARMETRRSVLVYDTEPFEDSVAVTFEGPQAATVEWQATQPGNSRWIQLKGDSGVGDGLVTWTVDPDSTDVGTYTDSVVVSASLATGSPAAFVYTLSVEPPLSVPALRPISSYGVSGWSFVSTDSLVAGLSGFGADSATWTASSEGSEWLSVERGVRVFVGGAIPQSGTLFRFWTDDRGRIRQYGGQVTQAAARTYEQRDPGGARITVAR